MSLLSDTLARHLNTIQNPQKPAVKPGPPTKLPVVGGQPMWNRSVVLYCTKGTSDKVYHLEIVAEPSRQTHWYAVNAKFGRRGGTLNLTTKTPVPVSLAEAESIYKKTLAEKLAKGYTTQP